MKQISKRERFYRQVGEAMSLSDTRSFINIETLKVDIHASEEFFSYGDMEDSAKEALNNPKKFLQLEPTSSRESFIVMEDFVQTVKDRRLQKRLIQAIENRKPFANFKRIIDDSSERQNWFDFRDEAYAAIAKDWLEENAPQVLQEKIKQ
jgi:hypothetical protein